MEKQSTPSLYVLCTYLCAVVLEAHAGQRQGAVAVEDGAPGGAGAVLDEEQVLALKDAAVGDGAAAAAQRQIDLFLVRFELSSGT